MTVFDLSWGHFLAVALVALVVIGPKDLPGVLRAIGQWTTKIRRMAAEFQGQFQEALREAEMADLRKEIDTIHDSAREVASSLASPVQLDEPMKWEPNPAAATLPTSDTASTDTASTDTAKSEPPAAGTSVSEPSKPEATSAAETAPAVAAAEVAAPATAVAAAAGAQVSGAGEGGVG